MLTGSLDKLEYGDIPPAAPPPGFAGVRPAGWSCLRFEGELLPEGRGLALMLSGAGRLRFAGGEAAWREGDLLVLEGGEALLASEETRCLLLLLEAAEPLLEGLGPLPPGGGEAVGQLMARQYQNALEGLPADIYTASAECYGLLMELHRLSAGGRGAGSGLVGDAMAIIREEYAYLTGIDELAERLEVSKSHLVRRFSAETGRGPGQYLQEVRLEQARLLLLGRDYSVELIAGMTGYSCANYFCKVFRGRFGASPGRYRELHRGEGRPDSARDRALRELEDLLVL